MLTPDELIAIQITQLAALTSAAIISRDGVPADDGAGGTLPGVTVTWGSMCRLMPARESGAERIIAERLQAIAPWVITFPAGTNVLTQDRVMVDGARTFDVIAVLPHTWETALRVVCVELE